MLSAIRPARCFCRRASLLTRDTRGLAPVQARKASAALRELDELSDEASSEGAESVTELKWERPLTIHSVLKYPNPKLRAPNAKVAVFGEPLQALADEMFNVMYQDDGVGLAAPQVGVNLRLMVFNEAGQRGKGKEVVLANPRIISSNKKSDTLEEGCLSFKIGKEYVLGNVERPTLIKIKAQDVNGKIIRLTLDGFAARVFQHEFDHLRGILFPDRFVGEPQERARELLRQLETDFARDNPDVQFQSVL